MGTPATISIFNEDNTVKTVSCNYDGYLSQVGQKLFKHYSNPDKLRSLLAMGNISSLEKEVDIPEGAEHSFDKRNPDVTTFYAGDRGESRMSAKTFETTQAFLRRSNLVGHDYIYKEKNDTWYLLNETTSKLEKLSTLLLKAKDISKLDKLEIKQQILTKQIEDHKEKTPKMKI
jgi:hypothetical protein